MLEKIRAVMNLFRQGNEIAQPGAWKNTAALADLLLAIVAAAAAFGYGVDLPKDQANAIAGGVVALCAFLSGVVHLVTSRRAGLPAPNPEQPKP